MSKRYFRWTTLALMICNLLHASTFHEYSFQAVWDPDLCLMDEGASRLNELNTPHFKDLKNQVVNYLKNSWCGAEKANLLMDLIYVIRPEICVEIGAFTGSTILPIAATLKHLGQGKVFAIDAWSNIEATKNLDAEDPNRAWWSTVDMNIVSVTFKDMIHHWELQPYCDVLHNPSEKAISYLDEIDFLHLDGDYSEKGSLLDVQLYIPKVRSGGYVLLSNLFLTVNGRQPKLRSFCTLFNSCDLVCEIEKDNAALFRKR